MRLKPDAPLERHRKRVPRFRAFYTVTGLAELAGVTRQEMRHILKKMQQLKPRQFGNRHVYYISDIRNAYPEMFEAIRLKREIDIDEEDMEETNSAFARTGSW